MKSLAHSEHLCSWSPDTWTEPTTVCTFSGYTDRAHVGWRRSREITRLLGNGHACGQTQRNSPPSGSKLSVYRCFSWSPSIPEVSSDRLWDGISILFLVIQIWLKVPVELHAYTTCVWGYMLTLHYYKSGTCVPAVGPAPPLVASTLPSQLTVLFSCPFRVWPLPPWGVRTLQAPASALADSDGTQQ